MQCSFRTRHRTEKGKSYAESNVTAVPPLERRFTTDEAYHPILRRGTRNVVATPFLVLSGENRERKIHRESGQYAGA